MTRKILAGSIFFMGGLLAIALVLAISALPSRTASAQSARAEVSAPLAVGDWELFMAELLPENEVPPIGDSPASGHAWLVLDNTTDTVYYIVHVSDIMTATGAHIHEGVAGVNGPVVVNLLMTDTLSPEHPLMNMNSISPVVADALGDGGYYINVHTPTYPGGEIRGQVMPMDTPTGWTAFLSGDNVVPPVATDASGVAVFSLSDDLSVMTYTITVADIVDITTATINLGMPGETGPVEIPLYPDGGMFDPANPLTGSTPLTPDQLVALIAKMYYVNIATDDNPGGEIRGQINPNVEYTVQLYLPVIFRDLEIISH